MSRKIRPLVSDSKNISLRNRGKVFPYKKCDRRRTDRRKDTAVYKRLLALITTKLETTTTTTTTIAIITITITTTAINFIYLTYFPTDEVRKI